MDAAQWIAAFRVTHDRAKQGALDAEDTQKYLSNCDELARSLLQAQGISVPKGTSPRRVLKVSHVFPIELGNLYRTTTSELSCTGFTALVAATFKDGDPLSWSLTLGRGQEPLTGQSTVTNATRQGGNTRVSCTFSGLDEPRLERLERALIDAALSRFQP